MWSFLLNILLFIVVLSVVICIHELGHFYFAKKAGILCHEFAFGMGPRLFAKKIGETTFSIRAIPFGGFVTMAGEEIQADVVRKGDVVRLAFDDDMHVVKIVLNAKNPAFQDLQEAKVETIDLVGKGMAPLFLNGYPVARDARYVFDRYELQIAPHERTFNAKTKGQRFLATAAGPVANILLAFVVYLVIALAFGVQNTASTVVAAVTSDMPADGVVLAGDEILAINGTPVVAWESRDAADRTVTTELATYLDAGTFVLTVRRGGEVLDLPAITPIYYFYGLGFVADPSDPDLVIAKPLYVDTELMEGDEIVTINGEAFPSWSELVRYQLAHPEGSTTDDPTEIVVRRDGTILEPITYVAYGEDVLAAMGYASFYAKVGIAPTTHFSLFGSFADAFANLGEASISIYRTLWLLVAGKIRLAQMSGFIGIYSLTANAAAQGIRSLLSWIGLLSVNLGIVNLLPIPALDGGRLAFIAYEAVTGRKANQKVENLLHTVVFFLLIALLVFISYHDILRLFTQG